MSSTLIDSLEDMENIVSSNAALSWDGWTVVYSRPKVSAYMHKDAAFIDGRWHMCKRYDVAENGWVLPTSLVGSL